MTTTTYPAGTRFADWSSARNVFGPLEAIGVKVGSRYVSPSFQPQVTSGKCISIPERDEFFARGWGLLINWEASATDALGGAPAGARYGAMCLQQLRILQHPVDVRVRISVSCDTDARNSLPTVNAYFHAFHDQLAEYAPQMDAYGGSYECDALAWCGPHWLTTSHGWSDPAAWAAINASDWSNPLLVNLYGFQTAQGSTSKWDMDVLIKPVTVWTGLGADIKPDISTNPLPINPPPPPTTGDDDMPLTIHVRAADSSRPEALVIIDGAGRQVIKADQFGQQAWGNLLTGSKAVTVDVDNGAEFDAIIRA